MSEEERTPTLTDYMAGAMLANGFVWMPRLTLPYFARAGVPAPLLADALFLIYLSVGIVSSYLVCKKATSKHLFVGLKFGAVAWVFSIFFLLSSTFENILGFAFVLLVIYAAGGVAGAYFAVRTRLRRTRVKPALSEDA